MSGLEVNKILASIILAILVVTVIGHLGDILINVKHHEMEETAYKIDVPESDETVSKIQNFLSDEIPVGSLADDAQFLQRALECYQSDIEKAENTGHEYFIKLLGDLPAAKKDTPNITQAIDKISQFSV